MGVPEPWVMGMDRIRWIFPFLAMRLNGKRRAEKISSLIRAFPMSFLILRESLSMACLAFAWLKKEGVSRF